MIDYLGRVWSAFSQLLNVVFLFGHPNESVSGRAYREQWFAERLINAMFFWQSRHCRGAYNEDRMYAGQVASTWPARVNETSDGKLW